jgi:NPCBM/NEW2 domain-containing protein
MTKRIVLITFVSVLCAGLRTAPARTVTVRMIDQTTVRGEMTSLDGDKLTIKPETKTPPATQPTTQSATQPSGPLSLQLSDLAQVEFHEPRTYTPVPVADPGGQSIFGILGSILGGSSDPNPPVTAVSPPGAVVAPPAPPPTTLPVSAMHWSMTLKSGDALHGHLNQWADQKLTLALAASGDQTVQIPANQLTQLWCGRDASLKKAAAMKVEAGPEDVVFVEKDDNVISVKGHASGITGESLQFRFGDEDRKIALYRLVGIVFAHIDADKPIQSFRQAVRLSSGDAITGAWIGVDQKAVSVKTAWGATLQIPLSNIDSIDFLGGRIAYLSDLRPTKVEQTPFFGRVIPFRLDRSLEGGTLQLSDGAYSKGIAVHSRCVLQYDIKGDFARFQSKLGFEDPQGKLGNVSARVMGDGKVLYENPETRGDQKPATIDLDVAGVQSLTLEIDFGKGQDVAARVIWANARLLRAKGAQ